jgi:hypothetical protein
LRDISRGQVLQQFTLLPNGRTTPRTVPRLIAKGRPLDLSRFGGDRLKADTMSTQPDQIHRISGLVRVVVLSPS